MDTYVEAFSLQCWDVIFLQSPFLSCRHRSWVTWLPLSVVLWTQLRSSPDPIFHQLQSHSWESPKHLHLHYYLRNVLPAKFEVSVYRTVFTYAQLHYNSSIYSSTCRSAVQQVNFCMYVDIDSESSHFEQYAAVDRCILNSRTFQPKGHCQQQSMELWASTTCLLFSFFFFFVHICTSVFASPCLWNSIILHVIQ